jgi:sugar O-acyltransferase (sialic acid O-acetyltransferase NeuD family)
VTDLPVVIVGAGGHARVALDTARLRGLRVLGFADSAPERRGELIRGVPVIGDDQVLASSWAPDQIRLINGLGSIRDTSLRRRAFENLSDQGYLFVTLIHPSVIAASDVEFGEGAQVFAGAVLNPGARVGVNALINTGTIVEHDCHVAAHAHLAPGVTLSGGVTVGEGAHLGTGSTVIQGVRIGAGALIAAGAVVVRHVEPGQFVAGVPARARPRP